MKPFNYEEFKAGRPAIRRDCQDSRFIGLDPYDNSRMIAGTISWYGRYDLTGRCLEGSSHHDLIHMAPVKKKMWVGVRVRGTKHDHETTYAFDSLEQLNRHLNGFLSMAEGWQICEIEVDV